MPKEQGITGKRLDRAEKIQQSYKNKSKHIRGDGQRKQQGPTEE
jgi:hypothetical protein